MALVTSRGGLNRGFHRKVALDILPVPRDVGFGARATQIVLRMIFSL